ncbi:MAG: phosphoribosylformylglycinamidine synthase subunit PurQ [Acidobacteriota bacterium]
MKFGIVVFPGSNCDWDTYYALKDLNQDVKFLWHKDKSLNGVDSVILPGGFSYGDYLRSGAIAKFSPIMEKVKEFSEKGGFVLGICNGFQTLLESELLPGAMLRNRDLKFICKFVHIKVENRNTPFTNLMKDGEILEIPIAHMDGNYFIDKEGLEQLKQNNQIVFRYCDENGEINGSSNPNGSLENIAGIINKRGNVMGMMPHPERASDKLLGSEDGRKLFLSLTNWMKNDR